MPINENGPDIFAAAWFTKEAMSNAEAHLSKAEDDSLPDTLRRPALKEAYGHLHNAHNHLAWCYLEAGLHRDDCATLENASSDYRNMMHRAREVEIEGK